MRKEFRDDYLIEQVQDEIFLGEIMHEDYVIELFKDAKDEKYYWQAAYDGEDRKLGNFNVWVTVKGISLYSEDMDAYPSKAAAVSKAMEWVDAQMLKFKDGGE